MRFLPSSILKQDFFGLSITQTALRAVSLSGEKLINSAAEVAISPAIFDHGVIDQAGLIEALRQLLTQAKFSSTYAAVSLPEYHSFTRTHQLPAMDISDVGEALTWQLEQIFPLPKSQIYFDWKLISQSKNTIQIVIIAVDKKILDDLVAVFEAAGIKPISFEPAASALTRVVTLPADQPAILIDISPYGSSCSLIENQISTLSITNQYLTSQDPQQVKQNLNITSQSVQSLANFFQSHQSQTKPLKPKMILTGDSASQDLAAWLQNYLNQPVELLQLPSVEPKFHHAYAAAASAINPPNTGQSINLLPDRLQNIFAAQRAHQQLKSKFQLTFGLLLVSLIISLAGLLLTFAQLNQTTQDLHQVEASSSNLSYNASLISSVNKTSKSIVTLFPRKTTPVEIIDQVVSVTPEDIVLKTYTFDAATQKIILSGISLDRPSLLEFRDNLIATNLFSKVNLPLGSLERPENITFNLSLIINP